MKKTYVAVPDKDGDGYQISKYEEEGGKTTSVPPTPVEQYRVNAAGDCECPGYRFRKSCRHVKFLNAVLEADKGGTPLFTSGPGLDVQREVLEALKDHCSDVSVKFVYDPDSTKGECTKIVCVGEANSLIDDPMCFKFLVRGIPVEVTIV